MIEYVIFDMIIKDLKTHLDNSNLLLENNVIWFELSSLKKRLVNK